MKYQVTPFHFEELIKKSYSLDAIYLLKLIEEQYDLTDMCSNSLKISALYQGLTRKGLVTDDGKISVIGKELLTFMESKEESKLIKKRPLSSDFENWWKAFPGTDTFVYKGMKFNGSRSLRAAKEDCRIKFEKILNEGEYTASQLVGALEFDVKQKQENSYSNKTNKLMYMQNSLTYLNQRSFEPFIELINEGVTIKESSGIARGTDI